MVEAKDNKVYLSLTQKLMIAEVRREI